MTTARWNAYFFKLCDAAASMSKDPSTKVGAVIVRPDKTTLGPAWNGFPRGCDDTPELYADRATKLRRTVHAETNAVVSAGENLKGCTIYVSPLHPCSTCAGAIIQAGIKRVVAKVPQDPPERWRDEFAEARQMLCEAGVEVEIVGSEVM